MGNYPILFLVFVILGTVGVFAYLGMRADKKRTDGLRQTAEEMGFEFTPAPDAGMLGRYPGFHLFSQGNGRTVENLLRGRAGGLDVSVFDYSYSTGGGKSRHTWRQTVLAFEIDDVDLPTFSLRPETVFHKIGQWFGYQDIDFETHPRFSNSYLLRGANEDAVRALFRDDVLEYYEDNAGVCTEGHGGRLVYFRSEHRTDPTQVRPFLEEGFRVLALFRPPKEG